MLQQGPVTALEGAEQRASTSIAEDSKATRLPPAEGTTRYRELDALRGLAAVTVVFAHFSGLWSYHGMSHLGALLFYGPLQIIKAAHSAVALFFVLSGFVLTLPALAGKAQPYGKFVVRRLTRVYLPYLGALAFAVGCDLLFRRTDVHIDPWFSQTWSSAPTLHLVLQHVLFIGHYNSGEFNTAFWTLVLEMRVSLIFPLLCLGMLRAGKWTAIASVILVFVIVAFLPGPATGYTIYAIGNFLVGILLARYRQPLTEWFRELRDPTRYALLAMAAFAYTYAELMTHLPHHLNKLMEPVTTASIAIVLLASMTPSPWKSFLLLPIPQWCGHISYSLYLVHSTVLFSLVELAYGHFALIWLLPIYLVLAFAAGRVYFQLVERPSMNLGLSLTRRFDRGKAAPAAAPCQVG